MNRYEAKVAARKERQADRAERLASEAAAAYGGARRIMDGIPLGQPILVGHHSERRHRADLKRIDNGIRKSAELGAKAEELARRAATESNAISSDDPDALDKLRERIAKLEQDQALMTAANKVYRNKKLSDEEKVAAIVALGISEKAARAGLTPDFAGRVGVPGYALTNNNANIRRLKERLASLEKKAAQEPRPDIAGDGWVISEDVEDNRLLITFDKIPDAERRTALKRNGFKWSPSRGAWVRMLNNAARHAATYALRI